MNLIANLSGKNASPPVNTPATGTAEFHINENGSYPYAVVNTQQVYPTGPVNGLLTSGEIKVGLRGPGSATVFTGY
jgi:hypothetical protein